MRHIEEDMQVVCVKWFGYQYPQYFALLHHSPNGGFRNSREAGRFKAMGTRAGFPDLVLLVPRNGYHALFVEMKTRAGCQTEFQKRYQSALEKEGYLYIICRSVEEFIRCVSEYLKEKM